MHNSVQRPLLKSARNFQRRTLRNKSAAAESTIQPRSIRDFKRPPRRIDFSLALKISAFLDEALNFFVTYFFQEKKVNRVLQIFKY